MLQKKHKRGFTLVELVIVIAVIAILSAILIPTFSNLVKQANLSADYVAVKNMNTALELYTPDNGKPANLYEARQALSESGFNAHKNLIPVTTGHSFLWNSEDNVIMLVEIDNNGNSTIVFPEKYKELAVNKKKHFDISYPPSQVVENGARQGLVTDNGTIDLDCSFTFIGDPEDAAISEYKDWAVDFVVYFDKDVKVTAAGQTSLAGQYDKHSSNWIPLDIYYFDELNRDQDLSNNKDVIIEAGKEINLLQDIVIGIMFTEYQGMENIIWDYEGICDPNVVGTFNCGAYDDGTNAETTMTVELRLYEVVRRDEGNTSYFERNLDNYIVAHVYEYTF